MGFLETDKRTGGKRKKIYNFVSTFLLVVIRDKWNIVSETTRLSESKPPPRGNNSGSRGGYVSRGRGRGGYRGGHY